MTQAQLGDTTALGRKTPAADMPRAAVAVRWAVAITGLLILIVLLALDPLPATMFTLLFLAGISLVVRLNTR